MSPLSFEQNMTINFVKMNFMFQSHLNIESLIAFHIEASFLVSSDFVSLIETHIKKDLAFEFLPNS